MFPVRREPWDGGEEGRQGKVKGQRKRGGTFLEEVWRKGIRGKKEQ